MASDIVITPSRGSTSVNAKIDFTGASTASSQIRLEVLPDNSLSFVGTTGSLFSIADSVTGSLMSVNDASGLPILEVFDTDKVVMGQYNQNTLVVNGTKVGIGTASPSDKLTIAGVNSSGITLTGTNATIYSNGNLISGAATNIYLRPGSGYTVNVDTGNGLYSTVGSIRAPIFYNYSDTNERLFGGNLVLRGTSPTIYLRDTDGRSSALHTNSNLFYILPAPTDSESYAQVANSQWPFVLNLTNNALNLGGDLTVAGNATISGGTITATTFSGNATTVTNGVYTTGSYADPAWITSLAKSKVGLGNVENTALSTWAGSANITTLGTITSGTWNGTAIAIASLAAGDYSSKITSGTYSINISGNAATATTASNVNNGTLTLNTSGNGISGSTSFTANQSGAGTFTVTSNATSANTASTIVFRDSSSNFSANTINLSGVIANDGSVSDNDGFGIYYSSDVSTAYAIYREPGAWVSPFPDLRIAFHTGIKLGANSGYNGIRFYNDYDMATQVMSVNNGSDGLGANNVYVNNSLQAASSLRAPVFYDSADSAFFVDANDQARLNTLRIGNQTQWNANATYALQLSHNNRHLLALQYSGTDYPWLVNDTWSGANALIVHFNGVGDRFTVNKNGQVGKYNGTTVPGVFIQSGATSGAPTAIQNGDLWWNTDTGKLNIWWSTANAWVAATPVPDMAGYYTTAGGNINGNVNVSGLLESTGNINARVGQTNSLSIGTHPTAGASWAGIWRTGSDYALITNSSDTLVNAPTGSVGFRVANTQYGHVATDGFHTSYWFRNDANNTGLYNTNTTQHLSSTQNGYWDMSSTTTVSGIRLYTGGHLNTLRGYVYANDSSDIGFLGSGGGWRLRIVGGDYVELGGSSARAQLFFDSNDTNYWLDPAADTAATGLSGKLKSTLLINGQGSSSGYGLALYPSYANTGGSNTSPTYGMMFASTTTYGTHGAVNAASDWATYFTMNGTAGRGWIFRNVDSGNVASLSNAGRMRVQSLGINTDPSATAGEIRATDNITAYYSDERLKTKLGAIENPIEKVKALSGFYFEANETAIALGYQKKREVGVSAQEVQAILPEIIAPAPIDDKYMTVRYEKLIPLLIEAVKAQQVQIEELQKLLKEKV